MKKIFLFLLIPVFLLFCGFTAPNNREFEYKVDGLIYSIYSDYPLFYIVDNDYKYTYNGVDYYYIWTYGYLDGEFSLFQLSSYAYNTSCSWLKRYTENGFQSIPAPATMTLDFCSCWYGDSTTPSAYNSLSGLPNSSSLSFSSVEDAYNYLYFSNLPQYYSNSIPAPDYDFYSASDQLVPTADPVVPIYAEPRNNNNYKIRVLARFYNVTSYGITMTNLDNFSNTYIPTYYPIEKERSDIFEIYGVEDLQNAGVLTANLFTPLWRDYINDWYANNSIEFNADQPLSQDKFNLVKNMVAGAYLSSIDVYNVTEIWLQYYKIENGVLIYGDISHWYNKDKSGSFESDIQIPAVVNTYNPDFYTGLDNTYDDTLDPLGDNVGGSSGSGGGYINNVPNYPDYPTIKSYNHDNILVQFIETAGRLPQFFADFGFFCTDAFSFIPSFIWQIIGFGFLGSIVIMIIKVL